MKRSSLNFLDASNAAQFGKAAKLTPLSLRRQLPSAQRILERLFCGADGGLKGMLLADDVGLGKTTIGAIVALVAAAEGNGRAVRILAPNMVVRQRWEDELERVLPAIEVFASTGLHIHKISVRASAAKLHAMHIHVTTQTRAVSHGKLTGDLIIVDEAHRSKSDKSDFRLAIKHAIKTGSKVLLLTATPMSIRTEELASMLGLLAGADVHSAVSRFGRQIKLLYDPDDERPEKVVVNEMLAAADEATMLMKTCVLRHSITDLSKAEQRAFGSGREEWKIAVPSASAAEIELLARADRLNRLAHRHATRSNDPQFHVARTPVKEALARSRVLLENKGLGEHAAVHHAAISRSGLLESDHPKMQSVALAIAARIAKDEKVVVFCYHHLVAAEMTRVLARNVKPHATSTVPLSTWRAVWTELVSKASRGSAAIKGDAALQRAFVDWICSRSFRDQVGSWITTKGALTLATLESTRPPRCDGLSIAEAMGVLLNKVINPKSRSTVGVFRVRAGAGAVSKSLPFGGEPQARIIGACDRQEGHDESNDSHLFLQEDRPDLLIELFNSPFGPDAVVLTDKYSEGIDLHHRCRLLVHYELNPSPMRTIQREGRIRRIGGWASKKGALVEYSMPGFAGTRDARVVQIMRDRMQNFGLLLGGMPPCEAEEISSDMEDRAQRVLEKAGKTLQRFGRRLRL